jgi:hypothetical protein
VALLRSVRRMFGKMLKFMPQHKTMKSNGSVEGEIHVFVPQYQMKTNGYFHRLTALSVRMCVCVSCDWRLGGSRLVISCFRSKKSGTY